MKKIIIAIGLFYFAIGTTQAQDDMVLDKIIATIGNEILLKSELEENVALAASQGGEMPENAQCVFLNQLLSAKLLVNQAKLDSVLVSDSEVEGQLNTRFDQILTMMNNDPQQFEDYYGMSISEARNKLRVDMKDQLLSQRMRQEIISSIEVTPSEVLEFFNQIPEDSLPYFNAEVEVAEIVFYPKPNDAELEKAETLAKDLLGQIEGGANFAELASKHSADPGSARLGGDLGWQRRGQFVPEFEAAAFTLEVGEISDVVETEYGFHIIQLLERLGNRVHTRHILISPKVTENDMTLARKKLEDVRMKILSDSITFNQAVKKYSTEKAQSYYNSGFMVNPASGTSYFETSDLEVDVYFAIDTMKVGEISSPIEMLSPDRKTIYKLVKLATMTEPHKASLLTDYNKIKTAAIEEKKAKRVMEWVKETIAKTYIQMDDDYKDCGVEMSAWYKDQP
ncbi:MAG: peptidylprolyl isomerase [Saprospiraceae bacterium]